MNTTLAQHRELWRAKPVLRAVYADCFQRIATHCVTGGRVLEIGGGTGNLKSYLPEIVSTDIQFAPWLDVVADAHRLPFRERSFRNVVLFDVLHHLERPRLFLDEAVRVLQPGGRLIVCEPAITPVSYIFYRFFHPESVRLGDDPLQPGPLSSDRDPYESFQALPTRLFSRDRDRLERMIPELKVLAYRRFSLFAYPLSGGFNRWTLLPPIVVGPLLAAERWMEATLGPIMAFRLLGVIERRQA